MSPRSRYPGTQPFSDSPDDYVRFFGRAEESEQLYLRVLSVPLLVQFGKSGLGKTSLLQAGLFPRLRQKPFLPVMIRLNDTNDSLTAAVTRSLREACDAEGLELNERPAAGLWELLSDTTIWRDDLLLMPVLVFDQFEEVFTLRDASFRADIATELGALASGIAPDRLQGESTRPDVKIVISLREDYLGALEEFSAAIPGLFQERLRLEPFTEKEAREAIVRPAQLMPAEGEEPYSSPRFTFEPDALAAMVDYLKGNSGVIEPFQLQLLARHAELIAEQKGEAQTSIALTLADFEGGQSFSSVLENFYRDTLHKILPLSQRKKAQILAEEGLLGGSGHRLMLEERQILDDYGLTRQTLETLSQERLILRERRMESVFYEISHDRLAESIYGTRRNKLPRKWRRTLWAAAAVALVIVAALSFFSYRVQTARTRAEGLIGFLLGEQFLGDVRDVGRSSLLALVQDKVENPKAGRSRTEFNRGLALRNRGDVHRARASLKNAIASFQQALAVFEQDAEEVDSLREAARTHDDLGSAFYDEGKVTQSLWHYEAAVNSWKKVVAANPGPPDILRDDCTNLADSLVAAGDLNNRMGRANVALAHVQEALSVASNILFGPHGAYKQCASIGDRVDPYPDAQVVEVLSRAASSRASILYFRQDYEGAAALATQARWLRPLSVSARLNERLALLHLANSTEDPQNTLDDYRNAFEEFDELRRWDSTNPQWGYERAVAEVLLTEGILRCWAAEGGCRPMPSLQEAEALILDGIGTMRSLAQTDPDNEAWESGIAWAFLDYAAVLNDQKRYAEALLKIEEAERIYRKASADAADSDRLVKLGGALHRKVDVLATLNRQADAKAALEESIALLTKLSDDHPDNAAFVAFLIAARAREETLLTQTGDTAAAANAMRKAAELRKRYVDLTESVPKQAASLDTIATRHVGAANALFGKADYNGALRELRAAETATRQAIALRPAEFNGYGDLLTAYERIGAVYDKLGQKREAAVARIAAMYAAQVAAWLAPEQEQNAMNSRLLNARLTVSVLLQSQGRLDESLTMVREVVNVAERIVDSPTKDPTDIMLLGLARCRRGEVRRQMKREGWEESIRSGLLQLEAAAAMAPKDPEPWKALAAWHGYLARELTRDGRSEAAAETALAAQATAEAQARLR